MLHDGFPTVLFRTLAPVAAVLVLQCPRTAVAQRIVEIPDSAVCGACRVSVGPNYTSVGRVVGRRQMFGNLALPVAGDRLLIAANGQDPFICTINGQTVTQMRVSAPPAGLTRRTVPAYSASAIGPDDSTALFDPAKREIQVHDRNFALSRSFPFSDGAPLGTLAWLPQVGFAVGGPRYSDSTIGYRVHLYSDRGKYLRSMVESPDPITPQTPSLRGVGLLQRLPNGLLVSVTAGGEYVIELIDPASGRLVTRFIRRAPWIVDSGFVIMPRITAIALIDGNLWIVASVLAKEWRRGVRPSSQDPRSVEIVDKNAVLDSMIEVVDLQRGQVLAQLRTDRIFSSLSPAGYLIAESTDSAKMFDILPVSLVHR